MSAARVRSALDAIRGTPLADTEFDDLWLGLSRDNGHKLSHLLIKYNAERAIHHRRWETALANWTGPLRGTPHSAPSYGKAMSDDVSEQSTRWAGLQSVGAWQFFQDMLE